MSRSILPPGRASHFLTLLVKWCGPHHSPTCFGSVQALKTTARGAFTTRSRVTPSMSPVLLLFSVTPFLLTLKFLHVRIESVEPFFPVGSVFVQPIGDSL